MYIPALTTSGAKGISDPGDTVDNSGTVNFKGPVGSLNETHQFTNDDNVRRMRQG